MSDGDLPSTQRLSDTESNYTEQPIGTFESKKQDKLDYHTVFSRKKGYYTYLFIKVSMWLIED